MSTTSHNCCPVHKVPYAIDHSEPGVTRFICSTCKDPGDKVQLYLEAHITIEPVFDQRREEAAELARLFKFKLAHLLMQKERTVTAERSDRDTFMTGHSQSRRDIVTRTRALVTHLQTAGFKVWRYKIEDTWVDSNNGDDWGILTLRKDRPGCALQCGNCS